MEGSFSCRICLQVEQPLIHIYEENLCDLLEKCGGIKVVKSDCYSKYLCRDCTSELLIAAKFREKCEHIMDNLLQVQLLDKRIDFDIIVEELVEEDARFEKESNSVKIAHVTSRCEDNTPKENILPVEYTNMEEVKEYNSSQHADDTSRTTIRVPEDKHIFECDACGASFVQALNLRRHIEKTHKTNEMYECAVCTHCFVSRGECERHCNNCEDTSNRLNLLDSLNTNDKKKKSRTHECGYCGKVMSTPFALNAHIRSHTGECPFTCDVCGKAFKTQASLSVHLKRHAGTPDFFCVECGKCFYETSNLKVHMKTHTGEKPHHCKICGQSFSRVFLLEIHTRIHTGEKPYKCDKCNRAFTQACDLRYHLKTHSGERHYVCAICKKGFIKRNSLFLHIQRHSNMGTISQQLEI